VKKHCCLFLQIDNEKKFYKICLRLLEKVEKDPFLSLPVKCGGETAADKIRISLKIISDILLNNKKQDKK
jgi:hypothetical protein